LVQFPKFACELKAPLNSKAREASTESTEPPNLGGPRVFHNSQGSLTE